MTLTPEQLAEARALVEKATAVSWTANHGSWCSNVTFTQPNPVFEETPVTGLVIQSVGRDNAAFIAAARSLVPALLDDVAALRDQLRVCEEQNAALGDANVIAVERDALREGLREALRWLEPSTGIDDPRWRSGGLTASELVPRFTEVGGAKLVDAVAALRQLLEGK